MLKQAQTDITVFPNTITQDEYNTVKNNRSNYPDWYVGLVGFCGSFSGKYFNGFARGNKECTRDRPNESIRNLIKQSNNLKDIIFNCCDFRDISDIENFVIYCDPPYRDTTKYSTNSFPYEEFYEWCRKMSKHNVVLISEYSMPNDFICIWQKETKVLIDNNKQCNDDKNKRIEKLFICK